LLQGSAGAPWVVPVLIAVLVVTVAVHFWVRSLAGKVIAGSVSATAEQEGLRGDLSSAFAYNTRFWRSIFARSPAGWNTGAKGRLHKVRQDSNLYIQTLNDRFTNPSGDGLNSDLLEPAVTAQQS
jgi:hypothetical protein